MPEDLTYSEAGVDRELRAISKKFLGSLRSLYSFSKVADPIELPYGRLYPYEKSLDSKGYDCLDAVIEGIGTKVLLAQLANKYDTIGIDAVAMAVNDIIRQGSSPMFILDNIDAEKSDPEFVDELMKGIVEGARMSEALVLNGEIADVAALLNGARKGRGFHIVVTAVGDVDYKDIIWGKGIVPGDVIIGARSSGQHSNGVSLTRKVLFKEWGGYYEDPFVKLPELEKELVLETLEPTVIYADPVLSCAVLGYAKAAVHVTGDSHAKFDKLMPYNPGVGFTFNDLRPQPIFGVIQDTANKLGRRITDKEMLKTYNMGDGFDLIVPKEHAGDAIDIFKVDGIEAWQVGVVTDNGRIVAEYKGQKIFLD